MKKLFLSFTLLLSAFILLPGISNAQYSRLYDFNGNGAFSGRQPARDQNLTEIGGVLYGMLANGGLYDAGVIFKINSDGTGYTKLLDFNGSNGRTPYSSFFYDGTFLYGTTTGGGSNNNGTVFKIKPDGTSFTEIYSFSGPDGAGVTGTLEYDGTFFYGITSYGGANTFGTIYKIKPDGTGFTTLYSFDGAANGAYPYGPLTSIGGFVYGMTYMGGSLNSGIAFKMAKDGSTFTDILDFTGANGSHPDGNAFYYDGTYLYGLTGQGGTYADGVMFKMLPDGTGYTKLIDFKNNITGSSPRGKFFSDGTYLYATLQNGGTNPYGCCFKVLPDGTGFTQVYGFNGASGTGYAPNNSFAFDGTYLYSMANSGGSNNSGTIFKVKPDGTGFATLFNFTDALNGKSPFGNMVSDGTYLYGSTNSGGANGQGTLYKMLPDGTGYTVIHDFYTSSGYNPSGSLYYDGTYIYGATNGGGTSYRGALFRIGTDGTGYTVTYSFDGTSGAQPGSGALISDGTYLYGATQYGGDNNYGTAYKVMPDGSNFTKLHDFDQANGSMPNGLARIGTTLYGLTNGGGDNNAGVIYKLQDDGSGFVKMMDFDLPVSGGNPGGGLTYDGTSLWGMTLSGGPDYGGTLFKILPDGTGFTNVVNFNGANGMYPRATTLLSHNGYLYGLTEQGGANSRGTIFKIKNDGTGHTILYSFGSTLGSYPDGSLITDGISFYGTTYYFGSTTNSGCIFKLCPTATTTQSPVLCSGESITVGGNTYNTSGTYNDTIHPINACDSFVITNLTVLTPIASTLNETVCYGNPFTVGGTTYAVSGTYSQTYPAAGAQGCDSTLTLTLNVLPPVDATVTLSGTGITVNTPADSYQWVDCNNGYAIIAGETNQSFNATSNGSYAVMITSGTCTVTSACSAVLETGISENISKAAVTIYPNPNNGTFTVKARAEGIYTLVNSLGQTVQTFRLTAADNYSFTISNIGNGIYFVKNDKGTVQQKIVVAN